MRGQAGRAGGLEAESGTAQRSTGTLGPWDGQRVRAFSEQQQQRSRQHRHEVFVPLAFLQVSR